MKPVRKVTLPELFGLEEERTDYCLVLFRPSRRGGEKNVHETREVDTARNEAQVKDGLDPPAAPVKEVRLPHRQQDPRDSRESQGPYDSRARPLPRKHAAFLQGKYQQDGRHHEKYVADEVDLCQCRPSAVSVPSFIGPESE